MDEKYDKYKHKYTEAMVEFAMEYFSEDGEPLSWNEAVDAMEDAGIDGQSKREYYGESGEEED